MPSPTINFRLTPYQIARGLWIVRKVAPGYIPTSCAQLVKLIYNDYLAKMSYGHTDIVPSEYLSEVYQMLGKTRIKPSTLNDITEDTLPPKLFTQQPDEPTQSSESTITSVTDFSPPTDWMDD